MHIYSSALPQILSAIVINNMDASVDCLQSTAGSTSPQAQRPKKPTKSSSRISAACLRCQRRKIRCDGLLPSCKPCERAGSVCMSGNRQRDYDIPRAYVADLKNRISWLESTVRSQCPDVNLETAPTVHAEPFPAPPGTPNGADQGPQSVCSTTRGLDTLATSVPLEVEESATAQVNSNTLDMSYSASHDGNASTTPDTQSGGLDQEIGLVSTSAGTDHRYYGPSSGYFFAKFVLTTVSQRGSFTADGSTTLQGQGLQQSLTPSKNILEIAPSPLPPSQDHAIQLSSAYFDSVHTQFPFLHQPTHEASIKLLYSSAEVDPVNAFQVNMVLAIAATILSRRVKVPLCAEGFCASAMKHFDQLSLTNSLKGLQCILLLLVYALNNPSTGLNMWYLHYQCIAAVIDMGLQRDVQSGTNSSLLEQQLRARAFWCIYTLDKTLSTIMGRPIGLRDEDCDCQLPEDVKDGNLSDTRLAPRGSGERPTTISNAIHLFKLARMNSEIKYFLHNISPNYSATYATPPTTNLLEWQQDMLFRLRQWAASIPDYERDNSYIAALSEIKYHGVVMLLLRPSPAIRQPSQTLLKMCYESAVQSLRIYNKLYKKDILAYSWVTVHTVFLSVITMLYCIWVTPEAAMTIRMDLLVADLKAGSDVLSATGEHWPQAKRSRDALEELSSATIRWLSDAKQRNAANPRVTGDQAWGNPGRQAAEPASFGAQRPPTPDSGPMANWGGHFDNESMRMDAFSPSFGSMDYLNPNILSSLLGPNGDALGTGDVNSMIQGLFSDFQPMLDPLQY